MKNSFYKILKLVLFIFVPMSVCSQEVQDNKYDISLSIGSFFTGKVQGSYRINFDPDYTVTIKNSASPMLKFVFDYNLNPKFSLGTNINFEKFNIKDIIYKGESMKFGNEVSLGVWDGREHVIILDDIKVLELNLSAKWKFALNQNLFIKPCIYIGYRRSFSSSIDARESGMVLNLNAEFQYYIKGQHFVTADLGFFTQPYGGVDDLAWVRSFGVPYMSVGYGFSFN